MKINYLLLTLGAASIPAVSVTTTALAEPEAPPERPENVAWVIPSNDPGLPHFVLIEQSEADRKRAAVKEKKESPIKITVAPNDRGVPIGIEFTEREEPEEAVATPVQRPIEYGAPARDIDPLQSVINASALLETVVRSSDGLPIGMVEDFTINRESGRIDLVAIGPGESLRLVQPHALERTEGQNDLTLNLDADRWENAPSVPSNDLDRIALQETVRDVHEYYRAGNQFRPTTNQANTTMRQRPSASNQISDSRSEFSEEAFANAREVFSQRSDGPSLNQSRLHQSSRAADRSDTGISADAEIDPLLEEEEVIEYGAAERGEPVADSETNLFRATEILGESIVFEGEEFAHVSDLITDLNIGYLQHVIITRDDNGAASFAVPLQQLTLSHEEPIHFLGDPSKLEHAPRFDARMARLHRFEPFRYDSQQDDIQYGAPERETSVPMESEPAAPIEETSEQPESIDQE